MGKKRLSVLKENDAGSMHVKRLGLNARKNPDNMIDSYAKKYGSEGMRKILSLYDADREGDFYRMKDADYDLAMHFSGAYDADIVKNVCNWIHDNRDKFGETILEIGCDCGFITTFLATEFPDRKIISIDRCQEGIDVAGRNCEKFGISNVEFICCDVMDMGDVRFDTIVSIRTVHENSRIEEDVMDDIIPYSKKFSEKLRPYAEKISHLLEDEGQLISIERMSRDAIMLGWIDALIGVGLYVDEGSAIRCKELGKKLWMPVMVVNRKAFDAEPFDVFMAFNAEEMDLTKPYYEGWDARIMSQFTRGEMIYDFMMIRGNMSKRFMLFRHNNDETGLVDFRLEDGGATIGYYDISQKDEFLEAIRQLKERAWSEGWKITEYV